MLIVVDGRGKMSPSVAKYCQEALRLWDDGMVTEKYRNNDVTAHIFQRTVQLPRSNGEGLFDPMQCVFLVKEKNGGKLNSHLWYFGAFARQLNPAITFVRVLRLAPTRARLNLVLQAILQLYE